MSHSWQLKDEVKIRKYKYSKRRRYRASTLYPNGNSLDSTRTYMTCGRTIDCLKFIAEREICTVNDFDNAFAPIGKVDRHDMRHQGLIVETSIDPNDSSPFPAKQVQLTPKAKVLLRHSE